MTWLALIWKDHKIIILMVFAGLVIAGVLGVVNHIYTKGEKAGASGVTTAVQGETIKQTEKARQDKEKVNEAIRDKPLDAVIDGLR